MYTKILISASLAAASFASSAGNPPQGLPDGYTAWPYITQSCNISETTLVRRNVHRKTLGGNSLPDIVAVYYVVRDGTNRPPYIAIWKSGDGTNDRVYYADANGWKNFDRKKAASEEEKDVGARVFAREGIDASISKCD